MNYTIDLFNSSFKSEPVRDQLAGRLTSNTFLLTLVILLAVVFFPAYTLSAQTNAENAARLRAALEARFRAQNDAIAGGLSNVTDDQSSIAGYWVNSRQGSHGLTRIIVNDDMDRVRVYTTCGNGGECYWGDFRLRPLARSYYEADFNSSSARRLFGIRLLPNGEMEVSLKTAYADNRPATIEHYSVRRGGPDRQNPIAFSEVQKYAWGEGISTVKYFKVGNRDFVFFGNRAGFNGDGHNAIIHPLVTDGRLNGAVYGKRWSEGWTSVEFYTVNGRTYMIQLKERGNGNSGNNVHIKRMNSDGTVGSQVKSYGWSQGWSMVRTFEMGGKTYLFLLKENGTARSGKNAHIHPFNPDGSIGARIAEYKWSENWTSAEFYREGNQLYLIRLKARGFGNSGNNVHVNRINRDGTIGSLVKSYKWTEGWTNVRTFRLRGKTYLSLYKKQGYGRSGKNLHIHLINFDGSVGRRVYADRIGQGWTTLEPFFTGGNQFMLRLMELGRQSDRKNVVLDRFY